MGVTEDIFTRCQQLFEESAVLLNGNKKITAEEINMRRRAANIAGGTAFLLLQKAFITPFDREDIWDFRQACEGVWEAAQEVALTEKTFPQGAAACGELALAAERLSHGSLVPSASLFCLERQFKALSLPVFRDFLRCGQQTVFCLQRLLLKSS